MLEVQYHLDKLTHVKESIRIDHARLLWQASWQYENRDKNQKALRQYIPDLKRNLHNKNRLVSLFCVRTLYMLGEPPNLHTLLLVLEEDNPDVQVFALRFIIEELREQAKPLVPVLCQLLQHYHCAVVNHACRALEAVGIDEIFGIGDKRAYFAMRDHGYLTWDDITSIID